MASRQELERWGAPERTLADVYAGLICTAITPFGLTGPRRDFADSEIVVTALSGAGYYSPGPGHYETEVQGGLLLSCARQPACARRASRGSVNES